MLVEEHAHTHERNYLYKTKLASDRFPKLGEVLTNCVCVFARVMSNGGLLCARHNACLACDFQHFYSPPCTIFCRFMNVSMFSYFSSNLLFLDGGHFFLKKCKSMCRHSLCLRLSQEISFRWDRLWGAPTKRFSLTLTSSPVCSLFIYTPFLPSTIGETNFLAMQIWSS